MMGVMCQERGATLFATDMRYNINNLTTVNKTPGQVLYRQRRDDRPGGLGDVQGGAGDALGGDRHHPEIQNR